jgi:alanyl-tRNA synthetase
MITDILEKNVRKKCFKCGDYFWTLNKDAEVCGDQPCVPFSFIGKPLGKKPLSLADVRESFLSFFEKNNHSRLKYPETGERCTVIARWRTDIYLTIASIADFQPHITSGEVPPPANPLVISQPCIRLNDLEDVGRSGRHLTTFEMMGHHSFNKNVDEIYFKEDTVRLCDEYFVEHIGIPREAINYKEQLWFGGGNAGPCLEVLAAGLEIATLVFMNMKEDSDGDFIIESKKYTTNPLNIVDTGYGLERIAWITQGTPTIYDTVFPDMLKWLKDHAKNTSDMQSIYSIADHTKCLAFMLGDGIVPSNVKAGYLARFIIRRSLRFMEKLKLNVSLKKLVDMQLDFLEKEFPSLKKRKKQIDEILDIETKRYAETLSKGEGLVKRILKEKENIDTNELITLYDTHGMPPEIVKNIAKNEGTSIDIPENFYSMIAELHSHEKKEETKQDAKQDLPETRALYYEDHYTKEFDAKVIWINNTNNGTEVILDQTAFYPEGGGQPADKGTLIINSREIFVKHVEKHGKAIIHLIDEKLNVGDKVHGQLDWEHRYTLMRHHTGTHVVNGALRMLLGEHIWQAGSQLGVNDARFDFAHYKNITEEKRKEIEDLANKLVQKGQTVEKKVMDRNSAEQTYGFRLYQGGVPPGNSIRVLNIPGIDVEACGGMHLNNINEIEKIRILKTERIQDGVNRLIFTAGKMVDAYQEEENKMYNQIVKTLSNYYEIKTQKDISEQLKGVSKIFLVPVKQVDKTIKRFLKETDKQGKTTVDSLIDACDHLFNEWKKTRKMIKQQSVDFGLNAVLVKKETISTEDKEIKLIFEVVPRDENPIEYAQKITKQDGNIAYLISGNRVTLCASKDVNIDLGPIAQEVGEVSGGSGGGKPNLSYATIKDPDRSSDAMKKAKELIKKKLEK